MTLELDQHADLWEEPEDHVLLTFPCPDGSTAHVITDRWSGTAIIVELEPNASALLIERMIAAGVEVVARRAPGDRGAPRWTKDDPQRVIPLGPGDAFHVRLADGRFQRVRAGEEQQVFCGSDHILAAPELACVLGAVAEAELTIRPALVFDPGSGETSTQYVELIPTHHLTPKGLWRGRYPKADVWHHQQEYLMVSPGLRAEIERRSVPGLEFCHGFGSH